MKKIYDEFFRIPKLGKIREKVMLTRVVTTAVIIVMCLAAMGITAYAYFSCNIASCSNKIKAASFEATVSITTNGDSVLVVKKGDVQTADLEAGDYTVKLSGEGCSADKGFCVITIGEKKYYTDQIGVDAEKGLTDAVVEFDLHLSEPAKIEISSHWGTSVYYGYEEEGRTEVLIENDDDLDLTTQTTNAEDSKSEETPDQPEEKPMDTATESETPAPQASEGATTPSAEAEKPVETTPPEPSDTTEPSTSTSEPETTEPTQSTESTEAESTETENTEPAETPPATENAEPAGAPPDETNE
ncbi:MAG: hypothetical protein IJ995_01370 [Clostridia bacterium]|nr:hypothetical protein [Clostridia bacterium]